MYKILKSPCLSAGLWKHLIFSSQRFSSNSAIGQNYYAVLGISRDASSDEVKKAYYEQSLKHHPDKKPGNEDKFREISSAYEVLGNVRLRKMYDKGIIAGNPTAIYDTDSPTMTDSPPPPPPPPESMSIPQLDQWARDHYSATFAKQQTVKYKLEEERKSKSFHSENSGYTTTICIFVFAAIIMGYLIELTREKEPMKGKSSQVRK